ncbi:MAG: amidohydrolase family protein [Holophaga sp.]|nr:amidohydrolase family protein [Holophaga sp.]
MRILIRNGRAALADRVQDADVLVENGRIAAIGSPAQLGPVTADRIIDAAGCYVLPGFMDFHTHVDDRIGRFYLADSYETASRVALQNGITTLCTFVTQGPDQSLVQAMATARDKAQGRSHCDVLWHLTPTSFEPADLRALETLLAAGYRTLKLYTTYKAAGIFASYGRIEDLFRRLGPLGAQFMVHCEDDAVIAAVDPNLLDLGQAHSHTRLRPAKAEIVAIQRVVDLALTYRAALHVVHVSTAEGARILIRNRAKGKLSFETCPQYLVLDDSWLQRPDGHRWLCSPPLRAGRAELLDLVRSGAADVIATDHCAFRPEDKDSWDGTDLRAVPNGLPGIGALAHVTWKIWEDDPDRAALGLSTHLALNPARRAGVQDRKGALAPGMDADIVVLDPAGPEQPLRSTLVPAFEAFPGFTSKLMFRHVLLRGDPRVENGRLLEPDQPRGLLLQPSPATLSLH